MRSLEDQLTSRRIGGGMSLLLHIGLIALLLGHFQFSSRGSPRASRPHAIQISMSTVPSKPRVPAAVPVAVSPPPKPIEIPRTQAPVPLPVPKPSAVRPPPQKPAPPASAPAAVKPPGEVAKSNQPAPPPVETPEQSLLGSIHDNWLEPAVFARGFRCRIHIDYLTGGRIANVAFVNRCGDSELVESVRKAVWKTQPLPLPASKNAAGSVEIEFTP